MTEIVDVGCHVTNVSALDPCPSYPTLKWSPALDEYYDGPLLGYPLTFFTTSLELDEEGEPDLPEMSVYPKGQDFLLFVKENQSHLFANRPDHFQRCRGLQHPSLSFQQEEWYSTVYTSPRDRYCKVAVLGDVELPTCIRVSGRLLLQAIDAVNDELISEAVPDEDKEGWSNLSLEERRRSVVKTLKFLYANRCRSLGCKHRGRRYPEELAEAVALHVWKHSELLHKGSKKAYPEQFLVSLIQITQGKNTHDSLPCDCPCDHWETVTKRPGGHGPLLERDVLAEKIVKRFHAMRI